MKILFLDQTGKIGGAELSLVNVVKMYRDNCLVGLFADGPFKDLLEQQNIPVKVLANQPISVNKDSSFIQSVASIKSLIPIVIEVVRLARNYDLIYTNTQKSLVVGALASVISRRPLVYHLRDILSSEHFSRANRLVAVTLANSFASLVIANSKATKAAFVAAGGRKDVCEVVYNGFEPEMYHSGDDINQLKQKLGLDGKFVVGHFSRLSPWKGQHILLEALTKCPSNVTAILVGEALFGEQDYIKHLHQLVAELGLQERVQFLGFRSDIVPLMATCDLIAHTSTAPEPFGRVIIEAMLCGRPIVASGSGGAVELIESGVTGWLVPPGDPIQLAATINSCYEHPELTTAIAHQAQIYASKRFELSAINQQIIQLLSQITKGKLKWTQATTS